MIADIEAILALVDKRKDGHWDWTGKRTRQGYPLFGRSNFRGGRISVKKAIYEHLNGELGGLEFLKKRCKFPLCLNPDCQRVAVHG